MHTYEHLSHYPITKLPACFRWFFPKGTYLDRFLDKNEEYFPFGGVRGTVFFHDVNFADELSAVQGRNAAVGNSMTICPSAKTFANPVQ